MSAYFKGGKAATLAANEKPPKATSRAAAPKVPLPPSLGGPGAFKPKPARVVTVKEHTRRLPTKPVKPPVNTPSLEPAPKQGHGDTKRFYRPLAPGQKPSGYETVGRRPGRAGIGAPVKSRPYWLATRGPTGDTGSQLNAAQLASARRAGVQQTAAMGALNAAVHPLTDLSRQALGEKPFKLGGAASDVANIATSLISPEKAGAAAGLFGLRGLKGLKVAKEGVAAAETARAAGGAAKAVEIPPRGALSNAQRFSQLTDLGINRGTAEKITHGETSVASFKQRVAEAGNPKARAFMVKKLAGQQRLLDQHLAEARATRKAAAPVAKEAPPFPQASAALRGAVSGKPARQALKTMGEYEKAGATLDNPNFGKSVRQLQKEQKALYSQERGKRAAAARAHLDNPNLAPEERVRLAKHELRGELPKVKFQGFTELGDEAITAMQKHILDHPNLMPFQKITASDALTNALTGKLPTPSELTLLEHVFGRDTAAGLGGISKHPFKDTVLSALNIPRSLMASFDLSAPFRQGLVVATRHPQIFARNFGPMVKAFGKEKVYQGIIDDIHARPTYPMMMQAKLSLTSLGTELGGREEQFASNLAEKIPVAGHGVRASGRAYTGYLDKTRADVFDHLIQRAQSQGINVQDEKFLKSLGTYINSATGRGDLGRFQEAGKVLNTFFFSPRLMASRLNFLNPAYYARLDPFARKEALRSAVQLAGTLSTLVVLASRIPGVKAVTDPRNPDWGKIKMGDTRVDLAGGFQQPLRLLAQLVTGTAISSTTGKKLQLTAGQFGQPTRLDLFLRFFEGKESPIASFATDWLRNSNQVGQKFSFGREAYQRMIPLLAQDSYDLYNARHGGVNGLAAAFAGYGVGSVGLGLQTYGPRPPSPSKQKQPSYFGLGSSGGTSPYFASSSGGGASPYFATP